MANLKREVFTVTNNNGTNTVRQKMKDNLLCMLCLCCVVRVGHGHTEHQVCTENFSFEGRGATLNLYIIYVRFQNLCYKNHVSITVI
jgi:hypothetical protein